MLVIGATGGTGLQVVAQAVEVGKTVRALVRTAEDAGRFDSSVEVVVGDALDPVSLTEALKGETEVISALGVRLGQPAGTTRSEGTATLVAAMEAARVDRLVAVSAVGVGSSRANQTLLARLLWPRLAGADRLAEAAKAEEAIAASSLEWTVIRAPRLIDGAASGRLRVSESLRLQLGAQLSRGDLAAALLEELATSTSIGRYPSAITGS